MKNSKSKFLALVASAALVATFGLAACGGTSSSSAASSAASGSATASSAATSESASSAATSDSASSAAASDSATLSALAKEIFQNCLVGTTDKNVIYFYSQSEDGKTAALLVYDTANDAFSVHAGTYEEPSVGTVKIDTKGAGEAIQFKVAPNADKTAVDFTFDNGTTVTMGPVVDESTDQMLQELDQLIAQVNTSTENASA